ncbi:MAG: PAS domain S-box protein [Gemmatimonadetes bacterium]|nr:PAS domain S-box protein [Gemmatimonadota bacterium]
MTRGTEEQETDAERSSRELMLHALFDHSFQYMGVLRPDGTVLDVNRSALEFGGLTRAQVTGRKFWELAWFARSPAAQDEVRQGVEVAAAGDFFRCELELVSADGIDTTVDFSIQPVFDRGGAVTLLLPEGRDVSELKWAERALRVSEAKAAGIVSIANDAIISVDETLMITDFNLGAEHIFGYRAREVLGKPLALLLPERYRTLHDEHVRNFA